MAKFKYQVTNKYGKERKGSLEAQSEENAIAKLEADGNIIMSIKQSISLDNQAWNIQIGSPVKKKDITVFCRQFYSILNAGVTVIDGLRMIQDQTQNKHLRKSLLNVQVNVEKGETLADAMKMEKNVFPDLLISMVAAGEATGNMELAFDRISTQFDKDMKLKSMITQAMIYPIMVLLIAVGVVIILLKVVIPQFESAFSTLGAELPLPTRVVMGASKFITNNAVLLLFIATALVVLIILAKSTEKGKMFTSIIALKIPAFRNLSVKSAASSFSLTMSTLIISGVPMVEAIGIVADTMKNRIIRKSLMEAQQDVLEGIPMSEPLERSGIFPPMLYHMIKIGEETGTTEQMLDRVAEFYEEEVANATKALTTIMEPLILIVLAVVVGGVVASVLLPMLEIYGKVG